MVKATTSSKASAGGDFLLGSVGTDTLSYDASNAGVLIDLGENGEIEFAGGGHADGDTGNGFENITGSSFADILIGNGLANVISGLAGNDMLVGIDGDDTLLGARGTDGLLGGTGADTLNGGAGIDVALYIDSSAGVTITLGANGSETIASGGYAQGDGVSNVENLSGTNFDDTLTGNNLPNELRGIAGHDTLNGRSGQESAIRRRRQRRTLGRCGAGYPARRGRRRYAHWRWRQGRHEWWPR